MSDLVTWLRAQVDEDERLAQAAAEQCGCHGPAPHWAFDDDENDGRIMVEGNAHPGVRLQLSRRWNRSYQDLFMARHIMRHDPARVLAEVDAKRRILDWHDAALANRTAHPDDVAGAGWVLAMVKVVKLMALPYADRPGYDEEWATMSAPELMTQDEHDAVRLCAELWNLIVQKIVGDGPARSADLHELAIHIHAIQQAVMSQAAARAHPDLYRRLGDPDWQGGKAGLYT